MGLGKDWAIVAALDPLTYFTDSIWEGCGCSEDFVAYKVAQTEKATNWEKKMLKVFTIQKVYI